MQSDSQRKHHFIAVYVTVPLTHPIVDKFCFSPAEVVYTGNREHLSNHITYNIYKQMRDFLTCWNMITTGVVDSFHWPMIKFPEKLLPHSGHIRQFQPMTGRLSMKPQGNETQPLRVVRMTVIGDSVFNDSLMHV